MKPARAQRLARPEPEPLDDEARVVGAIQEGLADIQAGRVVDDEESLLVLEDDVLWRTRGEGQMMRLASNVAGFAMAGSGA